jgi:hypothetical protein
MTSWYYLLSAGGPLEAARAGQHKQSLRFGPESFAEPQESDARKPVMIL